METSKQEWWSSADHEQHDLGGASPYVLGPGKEFLLGPGLPVGEIDGLDLGCWEGRNEELWTPINGQTVVGVDILEAAAAVAVARQRFPGVRFHFKVDWIVKTMFRPFS